MEGPLPVVHPLKYVSPPRGGLAKAAIAMKTCQRKVAVQKPLWFKALQKRGLLCQSGPWQEIDGTHNRGKSEVSW